MSLRVDADKPTPIQDLGITVGPGPIWIEQEDLNRSTCLQTLIRLGQVRVSSTPRCRVSKDPPNKAKIHTVGMSRPSKVPRSPVHHKTTHHKTTEVVREGVTAEQAQDMVNKAAGDAAAQAIAAMTAQMQNFITQSNAGTPTSGIEQIVQQAVSQALQSAQIARPGSAALSGSSDVLVVNGPEEPLFIPTGIVRANTESLEVQSESSADAGGLDDAATALKALRKKKS
jgi:hypothetical protein